MGGNALKKAKIERKSKYSYENLKNNVIGILEKYLTCKNTIELPGKEDFGDLDVIYINDSSIQIKQLIEELFKPSEIVINGDVISFDYENFQIDLIKCNDIESYKMYDFYLSYGDLGSIIGRISNYYGLKFGHGGLWLNLLENTINPSASINFQNSITKIELTKDPKKICEFLDFNYSDWEKGFESKKEIIEFIIKSKYFQREIFYHLNYDHRDRAKLRPFYKEFLDYIKIDFELIQKASLTKSEIGINYQKEAIAYFSKEKELEEIIQNIKKSKERKEKFNGKHLIEFGIEPKSINKIMETFKLYIEKKFNLKFEEWIDKNTQEEIKNIFLTHCHITN